MKDLKVIAFTHQHFDLKEIGQLVIPLDTREETLKKIQANLNLDELIYLSTCNRVEFIFTSSFEINHSFVHRLLSELIIENSIAEKGTFVERAQCYENINALNHLLKVSCSVESLVVGEKEILAQLRSAYDFANKAGLTKDFLRIVMNRVVKTAKEVYTNTKISEKPISVVSLAYRKLKTYKIPTDARILIIGAGETNNLFAKYLSKHGYSHFSIYNRTFEKAALLAQELKGEAYSLDKLKERKQGFDVIITCTGATEPIISPALYKNLLAGETDKKIVLDLAVPNDTDADVLTQFPVNFISLTEIKETADKNLKERYNELEHAEKIIQQNVEEFKSTIKQRKVEIAMKVVPEKIKEIRNQAIDSIFAEDIEKLDPQSRLVLEKVLNYMEKKYISVPMKMAKDILVQATI